MTELLDVVKQTAAELAEAGLMDEDTLQAITVLCQDDTSAETDTP